MPIVLLLLSCGGSMKNVSTDGLDLCLKLCNFFYVCTLFQSTMQYISVWYAHKNYFTTYFLSLKTENHQISRESKFVWKLNCDFIKASTPDSPVQIWNKHVSILQPDFYPCYEVVLKFGYSEKATKFEKKIFH